MSIVKCGVCLKDFYVKPSQLRYGWGKFCSTTCRSKSQFKGEFVNCHTCKKRIYRSPKMITRSKSGKYFCSKSCQTLWRNSVYIGEKNVNWVNGVSAYRNILVRNGKQPVCVLCKNTDERVLNAHHIDHQRSNNNIENLVWLCLNCHYLVHHDRELDEKMRKSLL